MLKRAALALQDPMAFFRWLSSEPPRPGIAYLVPLFVALVSVATTATLLAGPGPQAQQLRRMLEESAVSPQTIVWVLLVAAPMSALIVWTSTWLPIRLGAGSGSRLWEVAAWSQLPQLALGPLQALVGLVQGVHPIVPITLSILGLLWCTWFVYAGVLELARGRAMGAAVAHLIVWSLPVAFSIASSRAAAPGIATF